MFSLRDQSLIEKDETVELLKRARECQSINKRDTLPDFVISDDSEFFAGGTLAHLAGSGVEVTLVVCTDGCKGGRDIENVVVYKRYGKTALMGRKLPFQ